MGAIEVRSVSQPSAAPPEFVHSEFEVVVPDGWDQFTVPMTGAVARNARGPRLRRVEALFGESVVQAVPFLSDRLNATAPDGSVEGEPPRRFELLASVVGLPAEFELRVAVVLHDERRVEIGSISARHEPVRSGYEPKLQPLMVTSLGRTGSTLMMRMLRGHESIVVQGRFPFELWPARYWMHAFRVLTHPAARLGDAYVFDDDELSVGPNPFYLPRVARHLELGALLGRVQVESLAANFQQHIDDWYLAAARKQGDQEPRYFAEKQLLRPNGTQSVTWELYPSARELFLVRDFRDLAASAIDYSEKRGQPMRGWTSGKSVHDYVTDDLRAAAVDLCRAWSLRQEQAHLVRYEDLILRPVDTLASVFEYLGLDSSEAMVEELIRESQDVAREDQVHLTSPNAAASIGRWQKESDRGLRTLLEGTFSDLLPQFGYD